jgi:hypothetical protein
MMQPLQPQTIHVPAGVGVDESVREEHAPVSEVNLAARNVRLARKGSLRPRTGFAAVTGERFATSPAEPASGAAKKLYANGKAVYRISDDCVDTYDATLPAWHVVGRAPELSTDILPVAAYSNLTATDTTKNMFNVAFANGMYFVVTSQFAASGTLMRVIVHALLASTGKSVATFDLGVTYTNLNLQLQIEAIGNTVLVVYRDAATAVILGRRLDATSAATLAAGFGAASTLATDLGASDFSLCATATRFVLAYGNNSGGANGVTVKSWDSSMGGLVTTTLAITLASVSIHGSDSDFLWLAYVRAAAPTIVSVAGLSPTTHAITSTAVDMITVGLSVTTLAVTRTSATEFYVTASSADATVNAWRVMQIAKGATNGAGATVVSIAALACPSWESYTAPFVMGGRVFVAASYATSDLLYTQGVFDVTDCVTQRAMRPVALPLRGVVNYTLRWGAHRVVQPDANTAVYPTKSTSFNTEGALQLVQLSNNAPGRWDHAQHNGATILSGACMYVQAGPDLFESTFCAPPSMRVTATGAGGSMSAGTYLFTAIFEWVDALGNVYWSEPAAVQTVTTVLNDSVTIRIAYSTASWKDHPDSQTGRKVRIKWYRTNQGGGEFFLFDSTIYENDPALVAAGTYFATIANGAADSTSGEKLYRHPGLLGTAQARRPPPGTKSICNFSNSVLAIAENGRDAWMSGQAIGGEALWWSDAFLYPIASDLIAVREMDGVAYFFGKTEVYAADGVSPVDNGKSGGLNPPRRLTVDVGCTDIRSLCRTSLGIFFRSERGIELLTRGGEVVYVGERVERTLSSYPVITSAVFDPNDNVVLFTCVASDLASTGITLVFDMSTQSWVGYDSVKGEDGRADAAATSACVAWDQAAQRWAYARLDGHNAGIVSYSGDDRLTGSPTWTDEGAVYDCMWETPWIKLGLQHQHHVWQGMLLYERTGTGSVSAEIAYNWQDYDAADTKSWTDAQLATNERQVEIRPKTNIQALKLRLTSTPATFACHEFIGVSFDLAIVQKDTGSLPHLAVTTRK